MSQFAIDLQPSIERGFMPEDRLPRDYSVVATLLDDLVSPGVIAGANVLVNSAGREVLYHEAGVSDLADRSPITRRTLFQLFSMTKPSDPHLPPGTTGEKVRAGIDATLADMRSRGWEGGFCSILPDESAETTIADCLALPWDCVVIGGGIRVPSSSLPLFERVINAVGRSSPGTPIAFNTAPQHSADAAARWLPGR